MPAIAARSKLTTAKIRDLKPNGESFQVVWDSDQPGLGLRVRARGKVFIVRYRDPGGVNRRRTLGLWTEKPRKGALTLEEARKKASRKLPELQAGDEEIEATPVRAKTLATAFESFKETRFDSLSRWTRQDYQQRWDNHLKPALGPKRLDRITGGDVLDLYQSLRDKPTTANHVVGLLSTLWGYATTRGDMGLPAGALNPAKAIGRHNRFKRSARRRLASPDELQTFLQAVDKAEADSKITPAEAVGLLLVPYALLRPTDIVGLRWDWLDLEAGTITFPPATTKGQRISRSDDPEHAILSKPMVKRIVKLARTETYVIESNRGGKRYDLKVPYEIVRPAKDLNLYDLKSTSMTMLRDDGVSPAWIEAAARHRGQGVTSRHYSFDTLDQARKAIDRLAVLLEKAAKKKRSKGGKA